VQSPPDPSLRNDPRKVDGALYELDAETLAKMRAGVAHIDAPVYAPAAIRGTPAEVSLQRKHAERQRAQQNLRHVIACWAGMYPQDDDATNQRRFFHLFQADVLTACALPAREADELRKRITARMRLAGAVINGLPFPEQTTEAA
jgi:hypothetical protein